MKTTLGTSKTQRLPLPVSSESKQKVIDQNPSFSNSFLRQQMFLKPRSEHGEITSPLHRESEKIGNHKINGMGGSFISTNSRSQRREEENFKRMIVDLSHELLVKDSMIDSLRCELMASRGMDLNESNVSAQQNYLNIKNKSSYHFKSIIQDNAPIHLSNKNSGNSDTEQNNCQPFSLEQKATLSESQFIKVSINKNIDEQLTSHKRTQNFKDFNAMKQNKILLQLEQALQIKQKQLQTTLHQKKILSSKIIENQRTIIARQAQIKSLKNDSKKMNISKDDINKSMDSRKLTDYEQKINRLKRQNINISSQFEQLKRLKGQEIQSSIREWKKINQTMTDSLVKLNQQNSSLTKKLTDLEIRYTNSSTKTVQLQKQNSTLKYNLQNQKNSYSTLSLHHKHEKDQYTRRIIQLQKQVERMKLKNDQYRSEQQKLQHLIRQKQQNYVKVQQQIVQLQKRHTKELNRLKQKQMKQQEQDKIEQLSKQLSILAQSFKQKQQQILKQKQTKSILQQQLKTALKQLSQLKQYQNQKNTQIQHYKSKVSQLIQKVSQMKIQRINQINKQKQLKIQSFAASLESSIEVDNQNSIAQKILEDNEQLKQNQQLKQTILKMKQEIQRLKIDNISQTPNNSLETQTTSLLDQKIQGLEDINRRLGDKIRTLEQQILSLKSNQQHQQQQQSIPLNDSEVQNIILHNKNLSADLLQRDQIIHELRESLRRQEDNTISLKIHLDDLNKRFQVHLQIIEYNNKKLIANELKFGNYVSQTQEVIQQLKQDNEGLEQELKVIYQKLEYLETRLEDESESNQEQEEEEDAHHRKKRKESYKKISDEIVSSD